MSNNSSIISQDKKKNSNESQRPNRHSRNSRHSRTLSGDNVNKSGRNSIPFLIVEEKELPIVRKSLMHKNESGDEPFVAQNIDTKFPESIHNVA